MQCGHNYSPSYHFNSILLWKPNQRDPKVVLVTDARITTLSPVQVVALLIFHTPLDLIGFNINFNGDNISFLNSPALAINSVVAVADPAVASILNDLIIEDVFDSNCDAPKFSFYYLYFESILFSNWAITCYPIIFSHFSIFNTRYFRPFYLIAWGLILRNCVWSQNVFLSCNLILLFSLFHLYFNPFFSHILLRFLYFYRYFVCNALQLLPHLLLYWIHFPFHIQQTRLNMSGLRPT